MELTALDIRHAARELRDLVGARIEKVVQSDTDKRDVLFTLYLPGHEGKVQLRFLLPHLLCVHDRKPESYPQIPPGFAMFLRKYIGGARLVDAQQAGFDRLLRLSFEGKLGSWTLIVELLAPGNLILVGQDGTIKNLLENQHYKDRSLRGGLPYTPPPAAFDTSAASEQELADRIASATRGSVAAAIATALGLGGVYAEEACALAGVDRTATAVSGEQTLALARAVRGLLDADIAPHAAEGRVYPLRLVSRPCEPCATASFLAAIGASVDDAPADVTSERKKEAKPKKNKLQTMLDAQSANLDALRTVAQEEQRKGERIYVEYALAQEIIAVAQEARRSKQDIAHALKRFEQVKRYDAATGTVELEIEDV